MEARHALAVWLITLHSATALTAGPGILLNLYVPKLAPQPRTPPLSRTPTAVINRWNLALDRVVEEVPAPVERAGAVTSIRSPLSAIPYASLAAAGLLTLYSAMPALRALGATYSATAIAAPIACSTMCAAALPLTPSHSADAAPRLNKALPPLHHAPAHAPRNRPHPSDFVTSRFPPFYSLTTSATLLSFTGLLRSRASPPTCLRSSPLSARGPTSRAPSPSPRLARCTSAPSRRGSTDSSTRRSLAPQRPPRPSPQRWASTCSSPPPLSTSRSISS